MGSDIQTLSEGKEPVRVTIYDEPVRVMICDLDIPFVSSAWFLVNSSLAVIPAAASIALFAFAVVTIFAGGIVPFFQY